MQQELVLRKVGDGLILVEHVIYYHNLMCDLILEPLAVQNSERACGEYFYILLKTIFTFIS